MNLKELKELLLMLHERDIAEFELEEEGKKLRVRRAPAAASAPALPTLVAPAAPPALPRREAEKARPAAPAPVEAPSSPAPAAPEEAEAGTTVVKSPIVGTFYRSPDPNAPAFVAVGDRVKVGQVLCIIEAMKLMNEIEAEVAGEVLKIHHENGQPVQYGEPLFTLRT